MSESVQFGGTWMTLQHAAYARGVSPDTVRNWIRRGKIQSRKVPTPQGHRFEVLIVDVGAIVTGTPDQQEAPRPSDPGQTTPETGEEPQCQNADLPARHPPVATWDLRPMVELLAQMAERNAAQAQEIGALRERLRQTQAAEGESPRPEVLGAPGTRASQAEGPRQAPPPEHVSYRETPMARPAWWVRWFGKDSGFRSA